MNSWEYTDDNNPTAIAIRAIQLEAVARERARASLAIEALMPTGRFLDSYDQGMFDGLEAACKIVRNTGEK